MQSGRLSLNKNYPEMLSIARMLLKRAHGSPVFWVVGDTKAKGDADLFWEYVRALGLEEHVRLIPCVPHRSMVHIYNLVARSRGCVLSTSLSEGFQNSLLEGMACGVPVVSSAVGGNVELVDDGVSGRLYPLGHPDEAVAALQEVLGDERVWKAYARAGLARVRSHHTPEHHAAAFLQVLKGTPVLSYGQRRKAGPPKKARARPRKEGR